MKKLLVICLFVYVLSCANGGLINVGDMETYSLDANVNLDWKNMNTPSSAVPLDIYFTAGEYQLTFVNSVSDKTAWAAGPGWSYCVGGMGIRGPEGYGNIFRLHEYIGVGSSQTSAFNSVSNYTYYFTVDFDQLGRAYIGDFDTNNSGGLTFEITKIAEIPEPCTIILLSIGSLVLRRSRK